MINKLGKWFYDLGQALFWMPLRNGNGKVLNTEFATYATTIVVLFVILAEGATVEQHYSDVQFIAIISLLAGVLGIKEFFKQNNNIDENKNNL